MVLKDKVAIVTGGAQGLGRAYARRLLTEGARVTIADIVDPTAAVAQLGAFDAVLGFQTDVSSQASVAEMVRRTMERFGRIDVLVNNAALFAPLSPQAWDKIPEAEWDRVMAVNVKGMWLCCKAVVPAMKAQGGGRIINISSATVMKGTPLMLHYVTSKGAVIALTRVLARELGEFNIAVNALAPGFTLSDSVKANPQWDVSDVIVPTRCFKRGETEEDLEGAVVFLASEDSRFITGQTLVVDGGSVLY